MSFCHQCRVNFGGNATKLSCPCSPELLQCQISCKSLNISFGHTESCNAQSCNAQRSHREAEQHDKSFFFSPPIIVLVFLFCIFFAIGFREHKRAGSRELERQRIRQEMLEMVQDCIRIAEYEREYPSLPKYVTIEEQLPKYTN